MKNKVLLGIIFVISVVLVIINGDYFIALAANKYNTMEIGDIFDMGHELSLVYYEGSYEEVSAIYPIFLNANEDVIGTFSINNYLGNSTKYFIGKNCEYNLTENEISSWSYNNNCMQFNYNDYMESVQKWMYIGTHTLSEVCDMGYNDLDNIYCDIDYDNRSFIFFKEYKAPEFEYSCNPTKINYKEDTTCTLKVDTTEKIVNMSIDVSADDLSYIDGETIGEWTLDSGTLKDGKFTLVNSDGQTGNFEVFKINYKATKNIDVKESSIVAAVQYENDLGVKNDTEAPAKIKIVKSIISPVNNPVTRDINLVLVSILLLCGILLGYNVIKNKKGVERFEK